MQARARRGVQRGTATVAAKAGHPAATAAAVAATAAAVAAAAAAAVAAATAAVAATATVAASITTSVPKPHGTNVSGSHPGGSACVHGGKVSVCLLKEASLYTGPFACRVCSRTGAPSLSKGTKQLSTPPPALSSAPRKLLRLEVQSGKDKD